MVLVLRYWSRRGRGELAERGFVCCTSIARMEFCNVCDMHVVPRYVFVPFLTLSNMSLTQSRKTDPGSPFVYKITRFSR